MNDQLPGITIQFFEIASDSADPVMEWRNVFVTPNVGDDVTLPDGSEPSVVSRGWIDARTLVVNLR